MSHSTILLLLSSLMLACGGAEFTDGQPAPASSQPAVHQPQPQPTDQPQADAGPDPQADSGGDPQVDAGMSPERDAQPQPVADAAVDGAGHAQPGWSCDEGAAGPNTATNVCGCGSTKAYVAAGVPVIPACTRVYDCCYFAPTSVDGFPSCQCWNLDGTQTCHSTLIESHIDTGTKLEQYSQVSSCPG